MTRRFLLSAVTFAVVVGAVAGSVGAGGRAFDWVLGDRIASIGRPSATSDLRLTAQGDVNFRALHLRFMSQAGDFELQVPSGQPAQLNGYFIGTPTRTPIQLVDEGQGVTPLIVTGSPGKSANLQSWLLGDAVAAAIDANGNLRLGQLTLSTGIVNRVATLYATGPDGKRTVIARGKIFR